MCAGEGDRACPVLMLSLSPRRKAVLILVCNGLSAKAYLVTVRLLLGTHSQELGSGNIKWAWGGFILEAKLIRIHTDYQNEKLHFACK